MATIRFTGGQSAGSGQYNPMDGDRVEFYNSSTAGKATIVDYRLGQTDFYGNSTGGYATLESLFGSTTFHDNSNAGRAKIFTVYAATMFKDNSNAALATFVLPGDGAPIIFDDNASAGHATIDGPGAVGFSGHSTAADSTITIAVGNPMLWGSITFSDTSSAGKASITGSGRTYIQFGDFSTAGSAKIVANTLPGYVPGDNDFVATVDFSGTTGPQNNHRVSAGSIAGSGTYLLGSDQLTVGSLNTNTTVSGSIRDGGASGGTGGSLVKVGTGTFTLSGVNTYSGGTTVSAGRLELVSAQAAGLGAITFASGAQILQLDAGALGAAGGIFGNVLAGFDYGDTLDLRGLRYAAGASAALNGTTLTVTSGGTSESFTLGGNYAGRRFQVYNDGAAGSAIRVLPGAGPAPTVSRLSGTDGSLAATVGGDAGGGGTIALHDGTRDTVRLQPGQVDLITGFRPGEDVLNLGRILSAAHLAASLIQGGPDFIGNTATLTHSGGDATLFFNPAGTAAGPGSELAVLRGVGQETTLQSLIKGGDLALSA